MNRNLIIQLKELRDQKKQIETKLRNEIINNRYRNRESKQQLKDKKRN